MKDEIKEINIKFPGQILDYVDTKEHLLELFNYITNLQKEKENQAHTIKTLLEENERLKYIGHKMHLWIFLHSGDEQEVYDELGLTNEENAMLGYSGQFRIKEKS